MPLLHVKDLSVSFRAPGGRVRAVDGLSLHVDPGEIVGVVGESGSGKSVTALSIMALTPPQAVFERGEILFEGADVLSMTPEQVRRIRGSRIAMIYQDPMSSLNPVLKVGRQIAELLELHLGVGHAEAHSRTIDLLGRVGIPNPARLANAYPHEFSGGMRQRVMIAMAISCSPQLLIADEPTTALDVTIQAQIIDLLKSIVEESKMALILVTHDMGLVAGVTDRTYVVYAGQVVESGRTSDLFALPQMPYTWGLLRSLPRPDQVKDERLLPIRGAPPEPTTFHMGCRFEPRCDYARDVCRTSAPDLHSPSDVSHAWRCWATQRADASSGWLLKEDASEFILADSRSSSVHEPRSEADDRIRDGKSGSATPLLQVENLRVHFDISRLSGRVTVRAVDGVSFLIRRGETLALVGESGSGKTTTGRAILRLVPSTSGSVELEGVDLLRLPKRDLKPIRKRLQIVFQDPFASINPRMTVGRVVSEPIEVHGTANRGETGPVAVGELLATVGLSPAMANRYAHELSGGQRQRVGIARALAVKPDLIVADEPVSSLDVSIQAQIINLLLDLRDSFGISYLFISHDLAVVRHLADRVAVMYLGRVVELADADGLYREARHPYTHALLSAVPIPDPKLELVRERIVLKGDVPSPTEVIGGCNFRTRCWMAQEVCHEVDPPLVEISSGHWAACHFPLERVAVTISGFTASG